MEITISRVLGIKDFMTKIEKEPKVCEDKKELEEENIKYKNRREEIERKLIEEEKVDFERLKEKVKSMKSEVM